MPDPYRSETAALTRRLHGRFAGAVARRRRSQAAAKQRRALLRLDDHLLRDIGLEPRQIRGDVGFGLPV